MDGETLAVTLVNARANALIIKELMGEWTDMERMKEADEILASPLLRADVRERIEALRWRASRALM